MPQTMGIHETMELHEILTFKSLCLTKSTAMSALAQDNDLKQLLSQTAQTDRQNIRALQNFIQ